MASSRAATVDAYLNELPPERRAVISTVRDTIRKKLPKGYEETMNWGMISYQIPRERYPDTYNDQPLMYAALAAQKNHYAVYLIGLSHPERAKELKADFDKAGKKLDMGKSCVRFRKLEDIPLEAIAKHVASTPPEKLIAIYEAGRKKG